MTNKENELVKKHIKAIVENAFKTIGLVYKGQKENEVIKTNDSSSRIVFPLKRKNKDEEDEVRISEQELRFVFVEEFNKYCNDGKWDAYYSVETPTRERYDFSDKDNPQKVDLPKGQSAMVDLSVFLKNDENKLKRVALIEFKALNPGKPAFDKDFCKLKNEPDSPATFFVMIVKSHDGRTIKSLHEKIEAKDSNTEFYCYDLEEGKEGKDISEEIIKGIPTSDK